MQMTKGAENTIRCNLRAAKQNIDKACELLDKGLYLAAYANLNMGVADACKAQIVFAQERNDSMLKSGFATCKAEQGAGKRACGTTRKKGKTPAMGGRVERRATRRTAK